MKTARFIRNLVETAGKTDTTMPWSRGSRRAAFIAKRTGKESLRKSA